MDFGALLRWLRDLSRWDEWASSKMPLLFAAIYHAAMAGPATPSLADLAGLALSLCLYAMFGYMVNAWSDRRVDLAAGKPSALARLPGASAGILVAFILLLALAVPFLLYRHRPDVLALHGASLAMAALYSLPPVRFKERGALGLGVSAVAQRVLPCMTVFQLLGAWDAVAVAMCVLGALVGTRYIMVHQILDAAADRATGVRTVATVRGVPFLRDALRAFVFPLEVAALLGVVALLSLEAPAVAAATAAVAAWNGLQYLTLKAERGARFSPVSYAVFADYYNFFLPTLLSLLLCAARPSLWPVAVFNALWLSGELGRQAATLRRVLATAASPSHR